MDKGKLIVFEGACDGIGKTTQFEMLKDRLEKDGKMIANHHFPTYETYYGEPVVRYLKGEYGKPNELSPYFVNCLYALDRAVSWQTELKDKYDKGDIILLDRYTTSSLIYQSCLIEDLDEKKKFIDFVTDFEYNKIGIKEPDNVIFLHAPFDLVTELRKKRTDNDGVSNDIHERDLEFMKKVYKSALFVADYLSWDKVECSDNEEMRSREDIHEDVYRLVKKR
jgi:dTMP kinase